MLRQIRPQIKVAKEKYLLLNPEASRLRLALYEADLFIGMTLVILLKLPWWLFIKPLASFLYRIKKEYVVRVHDDIKIVSYYCKTYFYLFNFLPLYLGKRKKPTKKDLEHLFEDKASSMIFDSR